MSSRIVAQAARLTRWWVRLYTAGLPFEVKEARRAELESDLWEQEQEDAAAARWPARTALQVLRRLLLGMAADIRWRHQQVGARLFRRIGRAASEAARLTTAAMRRNWALGLVVLVVAVVVSAIGYTSQADARVDTPSLECPWLRSADERDADPAAARP